MKHTANIDIRDVIKQDEKTMTKNTNIPIPSEVEAVFNSYPKEMKSKLIFLRQLIYDTAASIAEIGELEETLKWGEPSYLTPKSKMGSTIRIAWKESKEEQYSIFFKCTANLVPAFKERFPQTFKFGGDRSIDFNLDDNVPENELKQCIALALTYHRNKKLETPDRWKMVENMTTTAVL
jgi:hypothetical protein